MLTVRVRKSTQDKGLWRYPHEQAPFIHELTITLDIRSLFFALVSGGVVIGVGAASHILLGIKYVYVCPDDECGEY